MEVKIEKLKQSRVKLNITLSAEEMPAYFQAVYEELAPTVKIDGFRPGRAPRKIIENVLGRGRILSQAIEKAFNENYNLVLKQENLTPLAHPAVTVDQYPTYAWEPAEIKQGLKFGVEVEVFPEAKLNDYSKIRIIDRAPVEVKTADVDRVIAHLLRQKANFFDISRPAKKGDFVEISFEGLLAGVKRNEFCSKNHPLVLGEDAFLPDFEKEIIGLSKSEEKNFKIKLPPDYRILEFAGREVDFKIKVLELKEIKLPKADDEFAKKFDRKDMTDLKKGIKESLAEEQKQRYRHELEEEAIEKILPLLEVEVPESLITKESERMIEETKKGLKKQGLDFVNYLKAIKKDEAELRRDSMAQAERNVRVGLLLGQIIREQKINRDDPKAGERALEFLVKTLCGKHK